MGSDSSLTRKTQNRWLIVPAAMVLNLALGALYSWPVFANHLEESLPEPLQWKSVETQLVFSMATVFLAVGVIVAGQLSERRQPKTLILLSALLTGGGYVLAGVLPLHPLPVTVTIGAMVGFGIGMAYALPISLAARWFPDREGLVTGLAMAGFGVGSVVWSQVFDLVLARPLGIRLTFVTYGAVFAALILLTRRFLHYPPHGYAKMLAVREPRVRRGASRLRRTPVAPAPGDGPGNFGRKEILVQRQLYYLFFTFVVGSAIGLMVIGMSKSYPIERLVAAGYSATTAATITRISALILFPLFNGMGRVVFGWLSDRLGWKPVMVTSYVLQSAMLFLFPWLMSRPFTAYVTLPLLAMCYGGNFTIFPVATARIWGPEHLAANYGLVFLAFGVGALAGPSLGGLARDAGIINAAFLVAGILLATGAVLAAILKKPVRAAPGAPGARNAT